MKKSIILIGLFFVAVIGISQTQKNSTPATKIKTSTSAKPKPKTSKTPDKYEMKQYFLVLLKTGPQRDQDSVTAAKIQEGHLAHLTKMYTEGKMDLAGPLGDNGDIKGICVYNVATEEEVKKLTAEDPAVKSGRLIVEIHPWWAAKGFGLR